MNKKGSNPNPPSEGKKPKDPPAPPQTEEQKESYQIKQIIHAALTRILTGKTKITYQQELHLISNTIQEFINITYVTKAEHENELLEQLFYMINYLKKIKGNKEVDEAVKELEEIAMEEK